MRESTGGRRDAIEMLQSMKAHKEGNKVHGIYHSTSPDKLNSESRGTSRGGEWINRKPPASSLSHGHLKAAKEVCSCQLLSRVQEVVGKSKSLLRISYNLQPCLFVDIPKRYLEHMLILISISYPIDLLGSLGLPSPPPLSAIK